MGVIGVGQGPLHAIPLGRGKPKIPGNNQHTLLFDTTIDGALPAGAGSAPAPGTLRGLFIGRRFEGWAQPTGQAITLIFEILKKPWQDYQSSVAADWAQDPDGPGGGSVVVAAATRQPFSWLPKASEARCRVLAGATGPSDMDGEAFAVDARTSGI